MDAGESAAARSSAEVMTERDFDEMFPDDEACLDYLKERFYPDRTSCANCGRPSKFHRLSGRTAYSCQFCGAHVYPTAGTVFYRSRTSLRLWFRAIYLISATHGAITARELAHELKVSGKTAARMAEKIGALLGASLRPAPPATPVWHQARRRP